MAPHVSRFVATLFAARRRGRRRLPGTTRRSTRCSASRSDFVRKRALPLVKGDAHVAAASRRRRDRGGAGAAVRRTLDREQAIADAGCALLDREVTARAAGDEARQGRRCRGSSTRSSAGAPRACTIPPTASGSSSASRRRSITMHLVQVQRPRAGRCPRRCSVPTRRCGAATASSSPTRAGTPREVLSEIHYCVLCHERDKDSCSKGIARQGRARSRRTRSAFRSPAARSTRRSPRCTWCGRRGDAIGALAIVAIDNPMCPGHRPPHLQRLHEGLHLPEAGAGQHPADRDRRADRRAAACRGASRSTAC